jgi:hypothetical protein
LPPWAAGLVCAGGLGLGLVLGLAAPRYVLGAAADVLRAYGYDEGTIAVELRLLHGLLIGLPCMAGLSGAVLLAWPRLLQLLVRLPAAPGAAGSLSAGGFVLLLLLVPLIAVELMALRGVPFLSPRNLLVLAPVLALAAGLGVSALWDSRAGRLAACAGLVLLVACAAQYETVAGPFGGTGHPLGMHTGPWKQLVEAVAASPEALVTVDHPETDPLLYYARGRKVVRARPEHLARGPGAVLGPDFPPTFLYVEVKDEARSANLTGELEGAGVTLTPVWGEGGLTVFEAHRAAPGRAAGTGRGEAP